MVKVFVSLCFYLIERVFLWLGANKYGDGLKNNGDALTCGSYSGIKLLEHAMKLLERVIEGRV